MSGGQEKNSRRDAPKFSALFVLAGSDKQPGFHKDGNMQIK
jgi:hypothetical protein